MCLFTWNTIYGTQGPQHTYRPYGSQVEIFHVQAVLEGARQHDEEVQAVPGVGEVRVLAIDAHRDHFNAHFKGEEGENQVVN